jgi:hypothetical protein
MHPIVYVGIFLLGAYLAYGPLPFILFGLAAGAYFLYKEHQKAVRIQDAERRREEEAEAARRRAEEEARLARERHQANLAQSLQHYREQGTMAFVKMPDALMLAEQHLDKAEEEFEARAFSPYWEEIEGALRCLGELDNRANEIVYAVAQHDQLLLEADKSDGSFPVSRHDVEHVRLAAESTRDRLSALIRKSSTDFQFSTIYEQRKTSAILIRGFQTLGDAIRGLGAQLSSSIDALGSTIAAMEQGMKDRHSEWLDKADAMIETSQLALSSEAAAAAAAAEQRERIAGEQSELATRQLAMLDNIQRHRRPGAGERGPRLI